MHVGSFIVNNYLVKMLIIFNNIITYNCTILIELYSILRVRFSNTYKNIILINYLICVLY